MPTWDDADLAFEGPSAWEAFEALAPAEISCDPLDPNEPDFVYPEPADLGELDDVWEHRMLDDRGWCWGSLEDILERAWEAGAPEDQIEIEVPARMTFGVEMRGLGSAMERVGLVVDYERGAVACGAREWLRQPQGGFRDAVS